ncbi:MAG: CDP-alcohol phosphatidyltransferase family protein [Balneolaceae bacterium]|nr:CDP-alcohol phosphatidyltransferase family protein [Balneolaceae bacterium]
MKISAYGVHLFTALGAALGLWALLLIFDGFYKEAIWVLGVAVLVDSIDGTLARYVDTKKNAPQFDGSLMDNIIDYTTWTLAPLCWIYATMSIPIWVLMICAVSSIFGFTNTEAKTEDNFFTGFPSYWNIVVLYLYLLNLSELFAIICLLIFAVSTFCPFRLLILQTQHFQRPTSYNVGGS